MPTAGSIDPVWSETLQIMQHIDTGLTVSDLLDARVREHGDRVFCRWKHEEITYAQLSERVDRLANGLLSSGIVAGSRVGVMLSHHPDHILVLLGLLRIGAIAVPINTHLRGDGLRYQLAHCEPQAIIADAEYADQLLPAFDAVSASVTLIWRGALPASSPLGVRFIAFDAVANGPAGRPQRRGKSSDIVAICYTSGTTGAPKGVLITDAMYHAAAISSLNISGIREGDRPLFWEPMYHLFGIEVVILALCTPVTLAMVDRFSASNFWQWARESRATHIHYVGGVLQLLLRQPPKPDDRGHEVRVAWGGGCPTQTWRPFEERFGVEMRDSFGMTETAALNIANTQGIPGALGVPLPYFEARVIDETGQAVATGEVGQLLIRGKQPDIVTPGYFRNPEATAAAIRDGWLHTGDLVRQDEDGVFWFFARQKDSIRRRGENVSAWEVERVINQHPQVEESAVTMVINEFGDEELKVFIKPVSGIFAVEAFHDWCRAHMAKFQVPRFVAFIDEFPRTPTQRIRKHELSKSLEDCWDAEKWPASPKAKRRKRHHA
ncbi:AMP-binding protein [Falsochrobactrum sp. TDYN1]|uniref:AMP-binding protein n=1 Tax=Falsochrobactrum tianjinense TaxID=2706015 RepID=A0A949PRU4_9HYPH|nr:AMP-binding protein [Falsochrobactrum sp. TDYN1]MBV2145104.1 AMP-binding protein [Falsochrobactrum sp. TDYN1]